MVRKQNEEANSEHPSWPHGGPHTSGPNDESPHGGGSRKRPPPCGKGPTKAAPHHVATIIFGIWLCMYFLPLAHTSSAFAPYCKLCFWLIS